MTAKVENLCMKKHTHNIIVEESERACINCIYYEQYFRKNRGNVMCWVPTSIGRCLLHDCERGPLRQVCKDFERMETERK